VSPEYKEIGDIVLSSSRHLLQLINDTLDLASLESGRIEFNPEPIDLVFSNYLSNAIKFTPQGGRVSVRVVPAKQASRACRRQAGERVRSAAGGTRAA
jgi:signal transduction histidine kinase